MIPSYLDHERKNYKMTPDSFHRTHKMVHFITLMMKNYTVVMYFSLLQKNDKKIKNIQKYICENFLRPTEGHWFSLFSQLVDSSSEFSKIFKKTLSEENDNKFNLLLQKLISPDIKLSQNNIVHFFNKIVRIKNVLISHGLMSEDSAEFFVKVVDPIIDEIFACTQDLFNYELFMISYNESDTYNIDSYNENDNFNIDQYDSSLVATDGLYISINNTLISCWPFLACRDGNILVYNTFDKKENKVHFTKGIDEKYIHTEVDNLADLFNIDYNYLNSKPLDIQVQNTNGIFHNIPYGDFGAFVGRSLETARLLEALDHPRHYITALDGIGGVGKTAIAIHTCQTLLQHNQKKPFEYLIWLSAKNTMLKDGKIIQLQQAFEHLGQLLDTILIVLGFKEYIDLPNIKEKEEIVCTILDETKILLVLDNLETIKPDNFEAIWNFIDKLPSPSKVLLTSREFTQGIPQTIRIENLSKEDSFDLINQFSKEIEIEANYINGIRSVVYELSSGLPVVIKSILGQIKLGKHINTIKREIENNTGNISKFCFEQQLRMLDKEQNAVILAISLSAELLSHDALQLIVSDFISTNLIDIVQNLKSFSIIKINNTLENVEYTILPIIKNYVLSIFGNSELANDISKRLSEYYELKNVDNYTLMPIEAGQITCSSLIPRKITDKAMIFAQNEEFDEAEALFIKATTEYGNEPYTWYMYSQFAAQYLSKYDKAIELLKKALEINSNYIYYQKIGDYNLKLQNYQAAVTNYQNASKAAEDEKNQTEMLYKIANANFMHVKHLRKRRRDFGFNSVSVDERNALYESIISNIEKYIEMKPHTLLGKQIRLYRMLSESYFGLKKYDKALDAINNAVLLSDEDSYQIDFQNVIIEKISHLDRK